MRSNTVYEILDARQVANDQKLSPVGALVVVQNIVEIHSPDGRGEGFEVDDDTFEDEDDEVTIHTPTGPVFCRILHADNEQMREYWSDEPLDLDEMLAACAMAQR